VGQTELVQIGECFAHVSSHGYSQTGFIDVCAVELIESLASYPT